MLGDVPVSSLASLLAPPLCWGCRRPAGRGRPLCRACARGVRRLEGELVEVAGVPCYAPVAYEGAARQLVRALKFGAALAVAPATAAAIVAGAPAGLFEGARLVPVPQAPARARSRGFKQAAVIAAALAERTGLAVAPCLARAGPATSQVGRGRGGRMGALAGAMHASPKAAEIGRALLVDDVVTTGATLAAGARALALAGAGEVIGVAYARTPGC
jgi:predicted amidophosphoribosyltransferase